MSEIEQLCWWCCHTIPSKTIQLPISFDEHTGEFQGIGQFCSFSCVKAYNNETIHTDNKYNSKMLIARFIQSSQPDPLVVVQCAPPREHLIAFGGHLTIDEFRKSTTHPSNVVLAPIRRISYDLEHGQHVKSSTLISSKTDVETLKASCSDTKVINNPLKIKKKSTDSKMPTDSVLSMLHNMHDTIN